MLLWPFSHDASSSGKHRSEGELQMKRLLSGLMLSSLMALTILVGWMPATNTEAASNITVTVNGCNAEVKWKPSRFIRSQRLSLTGYDKDGQVWYLQSPTLSATAGSYTLRSLRPGHYILRLVSYS